MEGWGHSANQVLPVLPCIHQHRPIYFIGEFEESDCHSPSMGRVSVFNAKHFWTVGIWVAFKGLLHSSCLLKLMQ